MRLKDRVAVVTGGGSGFGEGIARLYAREGAKVLVADLNGEAAERVAESIRDGGGEAAARAADVATDAGVASMLEAARERFGRFDVVVNNAGTTHKNRPMLEVDEATFDKVYAVNVKQIYHTAIRAVPAFRAQGGGCIIVIASTAGLRPRPGLTWYNGSKGAAIVLAKSMAVELAPDNIRVNALCPVMGETALLSEFMGGEGEELREKFAASVPMGRLSRPEDVAKAALYLASDDASFITGVALEVDGGRCV